MDRCSLARRSGRPGMFACAVFALCLFTAAAQSQPTGTSGQNTSTVNQQEWIRVGELSNSAERAQNYIDMVKYCRERVAIAGSDALYLAKAHNNLARAFTLLAQSESKQSPEAKQHFREAEQEYMGGLAQADRITDAKWRSIILILCNGGSADAEVTLNETDRAEPHLKAGIEAALSARDSRYATLFIKDLGTITFAQPRMAVYFTEAGASMAAQNLWEAAAWSRYYLAASQSPDQAIDTLRDSIKYIKLYDTQKNSEALASSYQFLGLIYSQQCLFEEAEITCHTGDQIWEKCTPATASDKPECQAECRNNRAQALANLGDIEGALEEFKQALSLKPKSTGEGEWATIENNREIVLQCLRAANQPQLNTEATLKLIQTPGSVSMRACLAIRFGSDLKVRRREKDAARVFRAAEQILWSDKAAARPGANGSLSVLNQVLLGDLLLETGEPKRAAAVLEQARQQLEATRNTYLLGFCLPILAVAEDRCGNMGKASQAFQQAVITYEARLAHVEAPERIGLFQVMQANTLFTDYADFLARSQRPVEALLMADSARSRGLARQAARILSANLANDKDMPAKVDIWNKPLSEAELQALAQSRPATLFLHYNIARDGLVLFTLDDTGTVSRSIIASNYPALLAQLDRWIQSMTLHHLSDEESMARSLGTVLLQPLYSSHLLGKPGAPMRWRHLVVVPDGGLHNVPFAALILPEPGTHRLIERLPVSVTASLRQLARRMPSRAPKGKILAISNPTGGQSSPKRNRLVPPVSNAAGSLIDFEIAFRKLDETYPGSVKSLVGPQASKAEVLRLMPDYDVIIFGTHGRASQTGAGLASLLLLAPASRGGKSEELSAAKILTKSLSARMAMLIACETAQGSLCGGEGNQGLVWAFWAAGCPAVVASLWHVEAPSAAALIPLYLSGLRQGLAKDVAMQHAILTLRHTDRMAGNWAAFQVYGDASPLPGLLPAPGAKLTMR